MESQVDRLLRDAETAARADRDQAWHQLRASAGPSRLRQVIRRHPVISSVSAGVAGSIAGTLVPTAKAPAKAAGRAIKRAAAFAVGIAARSALASLRSR